MLFEKASKAKLRFKVKNGFCATEDLWDLKLEDLDDLAKSLSKEVKESSEESFIKVRSDQNKTLELKFELVKYIITTKLKEKEDKETRVLKAQKKAQIQELIEKKELSSMEGKTLEELKKELELLD
jgi:hypothetical protein